MEPSPFYNENISNELAYIVGDVEIGENTGVWPGAVIRGDIGRIKIGRDCQIEDNSVLHSGTDLEIGDSVLIGHGAVVHCRRIGDNVLVGNNATLLNEAEIGSNIVIGANSLVSSGQQIPDNSFVLGVPARIQDEPGSSVLARIDAGKTKLRRRYVAEKGRPALSYAELVTKYKEEGL